MRYLRRSGGFHGILRFGTAVTDVDVLVDIGRPGTAPQLRAAFSPGIALLPGVVLLPDTTFLLSAALFPEIVLCPGAVLLPETAFFPGSASSRATLLGGLLDTGRGLRGFGLPKIIAVDLLDVGFPGSGDVRSGALTGACVVSRVGAFGTVDVGLRNLVTLGGKPFDRRRRGST